MALSIDGKPHYVIAPTDPGLPDIPEVQKDLLRSFESSLGSNGLVNDFKKGMKANKDKLSSALQKIKGLIGSMTVDGKTESIMVPLSEKVSIFGRNNF